MNNVVETVRNGVKGDIWHLHSLSTDRFSAGGLGVAFFAAGPAVGCWNVYLYEWSCSFTILFQNVGTT